MNTSKITSKEPKLTYFETLNEHIKKRYREKTSLIGDTDPYLIKKKDLKFLNAQDTGGETSNSFDLLPPVSFPDMYVYLISGQSPFTHMQLKNYKALEAYDQFVCGFVRNVGLKTFPRDDNDDKVLIKCQVMHSQRLREKVLEPWVIAGSSGTIHCGHCTCMAGLDECCTHIAALLFYVEYAVRFREKVTVTGQKAYWMVPITKEPSYSPVCQMDLSSAKAKKKALDANVEGLTPSKPKSLVRKPLKEVPDFSAQEMSEFWDEIYSESPNLAIFRVLPKYHEKCIPTYMNKEVYPLVLTELYKEHLSKLSFGELLIHSEVVEVSFTQEQAKRVQMETKSQAKSKSWHRFRAGRITASNLRKACQTDPSMPSVSLIETICYPGKTSFSSEATDWGINHERTMKKVYLTVMKEKHQNLKFEESGLFLNPKYPHLGASPDGLVECQCCGKGVIEIKCPYSMRTKSVKEVNKTFCLESTPDGLKLKKEHEYYYQVQAQMFLSERSYADFCVWTPVDHHISQMKPCGIQPILELMSFLEQHYCQN